MARGAWERRRRVAFGDGQRICWDQNSAAIFRDNPNIAPPGSERSAERMEWIDFRKGHRIYNTHDVANNRWKWNYDFRPIPGEVYLDKIEKGWGSKQGAGYVVLEPNVEMWKVSGPNKHWACDRYDAVAAALVDAGYEVVQFIHRHGTHHCRHARRIQAPDFRHALAAMRNAALYVGPEGGLHHGAAAVGIPAVVLFGGFIPPEVTGYPTHTNLTGGAEACGSLSRCQHCRAAMDAIRVDDVITAALSYLETVPMK